MFFLHKEFSSDPLDSDPVDSDPVDKDRINQRESAGDKLRNSEIDN